jgi:DNA-binding protein H-NS
MTIRDEYVDRMTATLKQWSIQLGELQARMRDAGAEQKAQIETAVAALKVQQTAYQEQMKKVRAASDAAFADLRRGAERMAEEFAKAYTQAFGRFAA